MGEQNDPRSDMEASRMASMEPDTKQASRGGGTGAVGGSHGARRADSVSGSCRGFSKAQSAQRSRLLTAFCLLGGFCVLKTLVGGFIGEPTTSQQAEAARAAAGRAALLLFGGGKDGASVNTSEVMCSSATSHSPFVYQAKGPERQRSLCEDAAAASTRHRAARW